jgi:hypothetical protein
MFNFDDARELTDKERRCLVQLMYMAFVEIRAITMDASRSRQARDLADAFHNVPLNLYGDKFSLSLFLGFLGQYQEKYKASRAFDYIAEWNKLISEKP